jgi:hypothetical protein
MRTFPTIIPIDLPTPTAELLAWSLFKASYVSFDGQKDLLEHFFAISGLEPSLTTPA